MSVIGITEEALEARLEAALERVLKRSSAKPSDAQRESGLGWISNAEARKVLGLSRATLQRYRSSGILPFAKVGSNIYYRITDVQALLESRLHGG